MSQISATPSRANASSRSRAVRQGSVSTPSVRLPPTPRSAFRDRAFLTVNHHQSTEEWVEETMRKRRAKFEQKRRRKGLNAVEQINLKERKNPDLYGSHDGLTFAQPLMPFCQMDVDELKDTIEAEKLVLAQLDLNQVELSKADPSDFIKNKLLSNEKAIADARVRIQRANALVDEDQWALDKIKEDDDMDFPY